MVSVYRSGQLLWDGVSVADTPLRRFMGLMGKKSLAKGEGMMIIPCNQVHTFHMHFSLDILFISQNLHIIAIQTLDPWRIGIKIKEAKFVLEVPAHDAELMNVVVGDHITIEQNEKIRRHGKNVT